MADPILDSLKGILDTLFGAPSQSASNPWSNLTSTQNTGLGLSGISPLSGTDPSSLFQDDPNSLDTYLQNSLFQKRERAFNTIDIVPSVLTGPSFKAQVPLRQIVEKVGFDYDNENLDTGAKIDIWRTVQVPLQANTLKIEFLPGFVVGTPPTTNPATSNFSNEDFDKPLETVTPIVTGSTETRFDFTAAVPTILLQFDDVGAPLLLAKNGDTFKCDGITKVFVTFKVSCPRFSLILGYNATFDSQTDYFTRLADLGLSPGYGIWENPQRHTVPFCITDRDTTANDSGGFSFDQFFTNGGNFPNVSSVVPFAPNLKFGMAGGVITVPFDVRVIIDNAQCNTAPTNGFSEIWITNVTCNVMVPNGYEVAGGDFKGNINMGEFFLWLALAHRDSVSGGLAGTITYTLIRKFVSLGLTFRIITVADPGLLDNDYVNPIVKNYGPPVRIQIPFNHALVLGCNLGMVSLKFPDDNNLLRSAVYYNWSVEGYTWGYLKTDGRITENGALFSNLLDYNGNPVGGDTRYNYGLDNCVQCPYPNDLPLIQNP